MYVILPKNELIGEKLFIDRVSNRTSHNKKYRPLYYIGNSCFILNNTMNDYIENITVKGGKRNINVTLNINYLTVEEWMIKEVLE